jgi:inhibitor of KinA sporulation pathway (predicted exonuclease)
MARLLDRILVIDVESTCWPAWEQPAGVESEIIEIGVAEVTVETAEIVSNTGILVRPQRSAVSPFCTQLTTLTQAQVDAGVTFEEACRTLRKQYSADERAWASYGDYDRSQFERQCKSFGVRYPFGKTHFNVKALFALVNVLPREVGMDDALRRSGLPLEGTHHRGVDDARNIANILCGLLRAARRGDS